MLALLLLQGDQLGQALVGFPLPDLELRADSFDLLVQVVKQRAQLSVWSTLLDLLSQSGARAVTIVTDMHGNNHTRLQSKIEEAVSTNPTVQFCQFSSVSSVQSVVQ